MKVHCHRSDRMAQQMYCGKSIFNNLNITFRWDEATCLSCRRAIRKKQVEYRTENPHLAHLLGSVIAANFAERAVELEGEK